jgi:hypothetical protein
MLHNIGVSEGAAASVGVMSEGRHSSYTSSIADNSTIAGMNVPKEFHSAYNMTEKHRYSVPLVSGLFNSSKLIPLKWMAAQWGLELTLASALDCIITTRAQAGDTTLSYKITNVNYIAEIIQFPDTFDTAFFIGLNNGGVPIKFNTWRYHNYNLTGSTNAIQISERARSIKAAYAVMVDRTVFPTTDKNRAYFDASTVISQDLVFANPGGAKYLTGTDASITEYQYRVGGKYFPAQPVDCTGGGVEAYNELLKCLDGMGDYTFQNAIRPENWTSHAIGGYNQSGDKFVMALQFENSDVMPDTITGISGEEQSDISLQLKLAAPPTDKAIDIFLSVDSLMIVETGNTVKLIL